jgi:hypothetical protein
MTGGPDVLLLSSSLLDDRKILYTGMLERLSAEARPRVWAASAGDPATMSVWEDAGVEVAPLPAARPSRGLPYVWLRRANEFAWDRRLAPPSRLSMMRHRRAERMTPRLRVQRLAGNAVAAVGLEERLEGWLEEFLLREERSPEAAYRLRARPPDVVVVTGPNRAPEPPVAAAARRLGIPVLAAIHSWDNLSTKARMTFPYDGYLVWSERMREELHHFYPATRERPVRIVGAPQFDPFFDPRFHQPRDAFLRAQGLDPRRRTIVHALGSPNFLRELQGALSMAERVAAGDLGDVQLIVRPHPQYDDGAEAEALSGYGDRVIVQRVGRPGAPITGRSQDAAQIVEWVNTFRHADVVVNLSSTVTVDAALFDVPVVNLDFDPSPEGTDHELVKDVNHRWTHFQPLAESGGVWLVESIQEMVEAVRSYLARPELHRAGRRWIAEYVCGFTDGRCGERTAEAILELAVRRLPAGATA